jgi:uncharacterized membrane-anchored protein YitT (DUF2179 family)
MININSIIDILKRGSILFLGAFLYAVGLRFFLLPNGLFDNGTTGICVIIYYLTGFPLGILFVILNFPFWIIGYKSINRTYAVMTIFSIASLSLMVEAFKLFKFITIQSITHDVFLASISEDYAWGSA